MSDTAWKKHERIVATYFGVERNKRGAHFGQESSCEVVAALPEWQAATKTILNGTRYSGVVVECKHGYSDMPGKLMRDAEKNNPDPSSRPTLVVWGPYVFSWMEDRKSVRVFERVWNDLINGSMLARDLLSKYYVEWVKRKTPKYLDDFMEQSKNYADKEYLPLLALHARGLRGRIIIWQMR